jgi:RNA-binding protein YhbY
LQYKVFISVEFKGLSEEAHKEIAERLEEHGLEKIPTISSAWEFACEAEDETDAKDNAIQTFVNIVRTYPCEMALVVQAGASQILRRKKKFDP